MCVVFWQSQTKVELLVYTCACAVYRKFGLTLLAYGDGALCREWGENDALTRTVVHDRLLARFLLQLRLVFSRAT